MVESADVPLHTVCKIGHMHRWRERERERELSKAVIDCRA